MQGKKVIAIFGGAFNPPLNSHFAFANEIINKYSNIERLIFMPVNNKYKKEGLIQNQHRYNMLKLICNENKKFEVSSMEMESNRPLYTIETLENVELMYPQNEIWFVTGTDNVKQLKTWERAERLITQFKILVLERQGDNLQDILENEELLNKHKETFIKLDTNLKSDLSSTYVRELIRQAKYNEVKDFIPKKIYNYIKENKLYI